MSIRKLGSLAISLAVLAILAAPAWSARVVEVRVGNHPTFTRVVFELDAPAGYRIQRREAGGGQELVVELDAASAPRKLTSRSPMVAGVDLEPSGTTSVARVRLRRPAPLVKELILGSPARIVLDLVLSETTAREPGPKPAAAEATKAAPKPVAEAPKANSTAKPPVAAKPPRAEAPPAVTQRPARDVPPVAAKTDAPEAARPETQPAKPTPPVVAAPPTPVERVETALGGERIVEPKPAPVAAAREPEGAQAAPTPAAPPVAEPAPVAKPPAPTPKPVAKAPAAPRAPGPKPESSAGPFGLPLGDSDAWLTLGLVGAGAILFLAVVAILLRRHSRPTSLDALEVAREPGEAMEAGDPFATIGSDFGPDTDGARPARETYPAAGPGLFDEETEKGDSAMAMDMAAGLPIERERGRMPSAPVGADSVPGPIVRELERRMTELETRLDQANEARERLERQVTAQSEELRVQRAAIARTQRALRGMSRGGEDQPTEPALRDPAKPGTRP